VLVERGAEALGGAVSPGDCHEVIVVRECESPLELFQHVAAQLAGLEREGKLVARTVIAITPRLEPQRLAARRVLGLAILSHVQVTGVEAELVLAVDEIAALEVRHSVLTLVEDLVLHPGSRRSSIRVRFVPITKVVGPSTPASGIHPRSDLLAADAAHASDAKLPSTTRA